MIGLDTSEAQQASDICSAMCSVILTLCALATEQCGYP
jgi:hypothetical protein